MKEKVAKTEYPRWTVETGVHGGEIYVSNWFEAACDITGCSGMLYVVQTVSNTTSSISVPFNSTIWIEMSRVQFQPLLSCSNSTALAYHRLE